MYELLSCIHGPVPIYILESTLKCFGADYSGAYELFRSLFTDLIHMAYTPYNSQD